MYYNNNVNRNTYLIADSINSRPENKIPITASCTGQIAEFLPRGNPERHANSTYCPATPS